MDSVAPQEIRPAIDRLLKLKMNSSESGLGPPIKEINEFISSYEKRARVYFSKMFMGARLLGREALTGAHCGVLTLWFSCW